MKTCPECGCTIFSDERDCYLGYHPDPADGACTIHGHDLVVSGGDGKPYCLRCFFLSMWDDKTIAGDAEITYDYECFADWQTLAKAHGLDEPDQLRQFILDQMEFEPTPGGPMHRMVEELTQMLSILASKSHDYYTPLWELLAGWMDDEQITPDTCENWGWSGRAETFLKICADTVHRMWD